MWVPRSHGMRKITCQQLTKSRPESSSDKICEHAILFGNDEGTRALCSSIPQRPILERVFWGRWYLTGARQREREKPIKTHTAGGQPGKSPYHVPKTQQKMKLLLRYDDLPCKRTCHGKGPTDKTKRATEGGGFSILIYPNPNPTLTKLVIICRNKKQIITIYKLNSININPPWKFGDWFKQQGRHRIYEKPPAQVTGTKNCTNVHPCQAIGAHTHCIALNNWGSIWMIMSASNSKSVKPYPFLMKKTEDPPYLQYRWKSQQLYSKKSSTT